MKWSDALAIGGVLITSFVCFAAVLHVVGSAENSPPTASATATPPATGRVRTWQAEGHWWVVGDGWGVHHPGCPCGVKAEVE